MSDNKTANKENVCDSLICKAEKIKKRPYIKWNTEFGMIASLGGVIIIPVLLGIWFGGWLDEHFAQHFSWRLSLLFVGFVWGGFNAYWWFQIEEAKIKRLEQDDITKQGDKK